MKSVQESLAAAAYALFALEQPLSLAEISEGALSGTFPAEAIQTPDWFAAASESEDLLATAPELRDDLASRNTDDNVELDLISVYTPQVIAEPVDQRSQPAKNSPSEATRMELLQGLEGFDD